MEALRIQMDKTIRILTTILLILITYWVTQLDFSSKSDNYSPLLEEIIYDVYPESENSKSYYT